MFYLILWGIPQPPERVYRIDIFAERHPYPMHPFLVFRIEGQIDRWLPFPLIHLTVVYLIPPRVKFADDVLDISLSFFPPLLMFLLARHHLMQ